MESAELIERALAGDQRAIARVVTLVADGEENGRQLLAVLYPLGGKAHVVGITGAPGAGKSTLVSELISTIRNEEPPAPHSETSHEPLAVVAVDPSSPFTGGAILGDRIRMGDHSGDPSVFIRSVANRGHLGGISSSTPAVVAALDGLGFREIIIETVGVGQAEVEIASACDTTIVVVNPGWGDGIQAAKAGLLEIADIFVVNKADRPEADRTVTDLMSMLDVGHALDWEPPIVRTVAIDGTGVEELWNAVQDHRRYLVQSGSQHQRLIRRARHALVGALRDGVEHSVDEIGRDVLERLAARTEDPWTVATAMLGAR
ncbi:MAG: methylmalonyl Co-A mutase-associated GTPase MeaB [Actinomycetota bacterium]|nr:methylmalonyl Co-A mutase-associated GTPase MeaB [Actinomycetota bacterium]